MAPVPALRPDYFRSAYHRTGFRLERQQISQRAWDLSNSENCLWSLLSFGGMEYWQYG